MVIFYSNSSHLILRLQCYILNETSCCALTIIAVNLSIFYQLKVGSVLRAVQVFHEALLVGLLIGIEDLLDQLGAILLLMMIGSWERGLIELRIGVTIHLSACDVGRLKDTFAVKLGQVPSRLLLLLLSHIRPVKVRKVVVSRAVKCL